MAQQEIDQSDMIDVDPLTALIARVLRKPPGAIIFVEIIHEAHCDAQDGDESMCNCHVRYEERRTQ